MTLHKHHCNTYHSTPLLLEPHRAKSRVDKQLQTVVMCWLTAMNSCHMTTNSLPTWTITKPITSKQMNGDFISSHCITPYKYGHTSIKLWYGHIHMARLHVAFVLHDWSFTYISFILWFQTFIPTSVLLCNKGIVNTHSLICSNLWFPLLCNEDTLVTWPSNLV